MARTKVLLVIPTLDVGGAEMDVARIVPRLNRVDFEVAIFTFLGRGVLAQTLTEAGIDIVGPFLPGLGWFRLLGRVGRKYLPSRVVSVLRFSLVLVYFTIGFVLSVVVRARGADVIHTVLPSSYLIGSIANLFVNRRPLIMSRLSQNWYQQNDALYHLVERKILHKRLSAAVANCQKIICDLREEGIPESKLNLIRNGICIDDFSDRMVSSDAARALLGIPKGVIVLSNIASLHSYKGHADLIRSLHSVGGEMPHWILIVAGRDVDRNRTRLESLCAKHSLIENVRFLGERTDIPIILSAADIHVSASHTEGLPNNIIEAMCARLPVVATEVGGTDELIANQKTGFLVPPRDPKLMGDAILRLGWDADLRRSMGEAGRRRVEAYFSLSRSVAAFERLYADVACTPGLSASVHERLKARTSA